MSNKEEALRLTQEIKGIVEFRLPCSNSADSIPDLINMLDDLRDVITDIENGCQCK